MKKLLILLMGCIVILSLFQFTPLGEIVQSQKVVRQLRYRLLIRQMELQMMIENGTLFTATPHFVTGGSYGQASFPPANQPGVKLVTLTPTPKFSERTPTPTVTPKAVTPISVIQPNSPIKPETYHGSAPSPTE